MIPRPLPTLVVLASTLACIRAEVKPNPLFSRGAVLQRGLAVPVWGSAKEGEKVTVSFLGQSVSTTTAKDGKWLVRLKPLKASAQPATLTIRGENTVTVEDVLVGDVWVCGGQSNMEFTLNRAHNAATVTPTANDPLLRLVTIPRGASDEPKDEAPVTWKACDPTSAASFSAVGYFFGRDLRATQKVPVGLISSNYGGTPAEAWTDHETLLANPLLKPILDRHDRALTQFTTNGTEEKNRQAQEAWKQAVEQAKAENKPAPPALRLPANPKTDIHRPSGLYNAMIHPLQPFGIRGVIWYQGESNNGNPKEYQTLFPTMIQNWRKTWHQGEFPFLFVQIAPFKGMSPEIREAQLISWKKTPNTAMAVITDVGDANDIHPKQKEPVGQRLALAARSLAYGEKIEFSGPVFSAMKAKGPDAILSFTHAANGLTAKDGPLKGFEIPGPDGKFIPAQAEIRGSTVVVHGLDGKAPAAVHYGWTNVPDVNLCNSLGLPATPFRTEPAPAAPAAVPAAH